MNITTQLPTVFGGEFVQEQHSDETHRYLPAADYSERPDINFTAILKALRSALSLRSAG
jgi:hypothetical protein